MRHFTFEYSFFHHYSKKRFVTVSKERLNGMNVFVSVALAVILLFILFRHLYLIWQIKNINRQIEFINTHQTNMIVVGEFGNGT